MPDRRQFLAASATLGAMGWLGLSVGRAAQPFETTNETILRSRQAALKLLKPTEQQLQRGLELHADAVVFDAYGFAPRAAVDGDAYRKVQESGASDAELADLREEMMMTRWATDAAEREEFLGAMQAAGVTSIFQNAGEEGNEPTRLLKRLARFTFATDTLRDRVPKAITPADVVAAKKAGRHCLAFTTNGVPLPMRWQSTRDELSFIRIFQQLGVGMMHLTYNRRNPLGDGAGESNDGGISDFGREAIAEMNRLGVIVDVAHSGWRTSREAAKASVRPMVASHTTCAGLNKHYRAKPDDTMKTIADTDGLIGICCIDRFLGGTADIRALLDHIEYAIKLVGPNHVAIGTDVAYMSRNQAKEQAKIPRRPGSGGGSAGRWEHLWPADQFTRPTDADAPLSLAWSNWPLFTVGLVQRGVDETTIRKILGENVLRVWAANQGKPAVPVPAPAPAPAQ